MLRLFVSHGASEPGGESVDIQDAGGTAQDDTDDQHPGARSKPLVQSPPHRRTDGERGYQFDAHTKGEAKHAVFRLCAPLSAVERRSDRASRRLQASIEVREIVGADGVEALRVAGPDGEETLPTRAVFPFVGLEPAADLAPSDAARDDAGALVTDAGMATSLPGLYAIGAVRAGHGGEIADALADAKSAAARIAGG
mgnify:CR=1 FL=1